MLDEHNFMNLYREVGEMLNREKLEPGNNSGTLQYLDMAYDGIEFTRTTVPNDRWWMKTAYEALEDIRNVLVTMAEDRLYTH